MITVAVICGALVVCLGVALAIQIAVSSRRLQAAVAGQRMLLEELQRVQTEAKRLERVRRDFVANISHELRTPLASIKLLVDTLEEGALSDAEVARSFTRKIGAETEHLIGMAEELLELARLEAAPVLRMCPLDPATATSAAVERMRPLARHRQVELVFSGSTTLPQVWADRDLVERVVINLLTNALTVTPPGGQVTVQLSRENQAVACTVMDSGPGIPPGEEGRIFERFYKIDSARERGGTGLGLSIARHSIEAQGGRIWVVNQETGGACFTFTLPIAAETGDRG